MCFGTDVQFSLKPSDFIAEHLRKLIDEVLARKPGNVDWVLIRRSLFDEVVHFFTRRDQPKMLCCLCTKERSLAFFHSQKLLPGKVPSRLCTQVQDARACCLSSCSIEQGQHDLVSLPIYRIPFQFIGLAQNVSICKVMLAPTAITSTNSLFRITGACARFFA